MRYPIVNLGFQGMGAVLNTVPRGLSEGQISKICELVETANESSSERDRKDAADTIRAWMESLPGNAQDPASDKGTMKRYINQFCKNGLAFLQKYQPDIPVGAPVATPPRYERPPVATPPLKPPPPPGAPVATPKTYGPLVPPPVPTPSTIQTKVPQTILDQLCQALKAMQEDPQNETMYAEAFKKLFMQYATTSEMWTAIAEYLARNCMEVDFGKIWQIRPYEGVKTPSIYRKPVATLTPTPTPPRIPLENVPTEGAGFPTSTGFAPPSPQLPRYTDVPTPSTPQYGTDLQRQIDSYTQKLKEFSERPATPTPRATSQSDQYNLTPPSMRPGSGPCPSGQFINPNYPERGCQPLGGGGLPGLPGLTDGGATVTPGSIAPTGVATSFAGMGRRYPVVNL